LRARDVLRDLVRRIAVGVAFEDLGGSGARLPLAHGAGRLRRRKRARQRQDHDASQRSATVHLQSPM